MAERIDVGKLRGAYYNNSKDSYSDSTSLSNMKQSLSLENDALLVNGPDASFNDVETMIVEHIKTMPVADYNDISNKDSKTLADIEAYTNLINVIAMFNDIASLSTIILIYCDYFNLKYHKVIMELPNGLKLKLYDELKMHTRDHSILESLFGFESGSHVKRLF